MKKTLLIILLFALLILTGCTESKKKQTDTSSSSSTLKLGDIQPLFKPAHPGEIIITAIVYEIPEKNKKYIDQIFKELSKQYLIFTDLDVFEMNGFRAGFGMQKDWPSITNNLYLASAQNIVSSNLIFIDSSSSDVPVGNSYDSQTFYLAKKADNYELIKLSEGQLAWKVSARALPKKQGMGLVQIKAIHEEEVLPALAKVPGYETVGETAFHDIAVKLNITPGEFVVIGPDMKESERITLSELFFQRTGDILTPIPLDEQNIENTNLKYKVEKKVKLLRLYVFACTGIKS